MKKKRVWIVVIIVLFVVGGVMGLNYWNSHRMDIPYYELEQRKVILSDKINKTTSDQENGLFYLARQSAKKATISEDGAESKWKNLKDSSLYVEKAKEKHVYLFYYVVQSSKPMKLKIRYEIKLRLNNPSLYTNKLSYDIIEFNLDGFE